MLMSTARASLLLNVLLAIVCVLLLQQNRDLKRGTPAIRASSALRSGIRVAPFSYRTLGGQQATLGFGDARRRTLLFVISTTCPWCEQSVPQIQAIARAVRGDRVRLMAVSIHDPAPTRSFAAEQRVDFDLVCAAASDEFQRDYRIEGVPTTLLVNGDGVVLGVWEGAITPELAREIESAVQRS
jgi:peroxiredoxin